MASPTKRGPGLAGQMVVAFVLCFALSLATVDLVINVGLPLAGIPGRGAVEANALGAAVARAAEEKAASTDAWFEARYDQARAAASLLSSSTLAQLKAGEANRILDSFLAASRSIHGILLCTAKEGLVVATRAKPLGEGHLAEEPGIWTGFLPFSSADGAGLILMLDIDLGGLLSMGVQGNKAGILILGPDYLTLGSKALSGPGFATEEFLDLAARIRRGGSIPDKAFPVYSGSGARYLAAIRPTGSSAKVKLHVMAYAPEAGSLEGGARPESLAFIASILAGLLGSVMAFLTMRRLTRPLAQLEKAVVAFSHGDEKAVLPAKAPREIRLIAEAYGKMMERARDWKHELEAEVLARTAELSVKSAIVRALVELEADESAYQIVLGSLVSHMGGEAGLIEYIDASRVTCIVGTRSSACLSPSRDDLRALEAAAERGSGPFGRLGYTFYFSLARQLLSPEHGEAGLVLVGRNDRDFSTKEVLLLEHVIEELGPLVAAREARMRQSHVRRAAEKALRRSEERLRTFFEESHDMIYTANTEDIIASINAAGLALLGCNDRFEAVGRPFSNFVLNLEDRSLFHQRIREMGYVNDYELVLKRPDGSTVFCLETAQAVKDATGAVVEIQGIIKDISERINNERELWRTNMELAETNLQLKKTQVVIVQQEKLASIGQLAAGIAHEINNPLGFLKSNHSVMARFAASLRQAWGEAEALAPEALTGLAAKHDLEYIFSEIDTLMSESDDGFRRIMEIVKNLKNFARTDSETSISNYNLNRGIESTLVVAWNEVKYVAEVDKRLGDIPEIEADGGGINQVILNLLINSAQAIESQGRGEKGRITIETALEGPNISCTISDNGPGIPAETRFRIFDPFFTTKDPGKGTGLGLSISYDIIVNKHGGSITVGDAPGGGASFKIVLPVQHPKAPEKKDDDPRLEDR